jgi:AcrR family transcriptional regulator
MVGRMTDPTAARLGELAARYSPAKRRTIDAALRLFALHGVGGTSLQMIADDVGVTKAAVYHQFPTKDEIVLAVIEVQLTPIEEALERAEASRPGRRRREQLLADLVDVVVANRRSLSTLQSEPVLFRLLGEHPPSLRMWIRLFGVLLGDDTNARTRVRASVISATLGSVAYPFVVDLDSDTLRRELLAVTRLLLFAQG